MSVIRREDINSPLDKVVKVAEDVCANLLEALKQPLTQNTEDERLARERALTMLDDRKKKISQLVDVFAGRFEPILAIADPRLIGRIKMFVAGIHDLTFFVQNALDNIRKWIMNMMNSFIKSVKSFWERLKAMFKEAAENLAEQFEKKCKIV